MRWMARIIAFVILIVGISILVMGLDMADTVSNKFLKEMSGDYPAKTKWYIFGGVAAIAISFGYLIYSFIRKSKL